MAARYLLDTNICIYIARHHPPAVRQRFAALHPGDAAMSIITYGELRFGAEKSQHPQQAVERLERIAALIPAQPLPLAAAEHYARIRARLERAGQSIGGNDLWIAAHALAEGMILVTSNVRGFQRVDGLRLENWAEEEFPGSP